MDVKVNTTNNYENLCTLMHKRLPSIETLISRNAKEVSEISQVHLRAGCNELTAVIN